MVYIIAIMVLIVGAIELILSRSWNATYFRVGIPIYRKKFNLQSHAESPPPAAQIQAEISSSFFPKFQVRELDSSSQAFQEVGKAWFRYNSIMHGLLRYENHEKRLVVTGYLNWFWPLFIFSVFIALLLYGTWDARYDITLTLLWLVIFLFHLLIFPLIYLVQALRFRKVGQVVANLWAKGNYQEHRVSDEERSHKITLIPFRYILLGTILSLMLCCNLLSTFMERALVGSLDLISPYLPKYEGKNPPSATFKFEEFPYNYREASGSRTGPPYYRQSPTFSIWTMFWYANYERLVQPSFKKQELEARWIKVSPIRHKPHPIFVLSLSEEKEARLRELQEMKDYEEALDFFRLIERIEDDLDLWQDGNWVAAKEDWERKRTQAMIIELYLLYLDDQPILEPEIYDDLDLFISNIGQEGWYDDFANHLDKYWPYSCFLWWCSTD